ncbi:helix-turn-helix domain-containing protein [Staphylococcus pasteuri]|uniref:helix-turn-helix domain-containing protein n=1 Tax=Staphylococcus pasteuri TaxID=45972 RepID=UPI003D049299
MINIGNQINKLRVRKKLSQKDLAYILKISTTKVNKWENNEELPEIEMLVKLSEFFEVPIEQLLTGNKNKNTNFWDFMNELLKKWWLIFPIGAFITWIFH